MYKCVLKENLHITLHNENSFHHEEKLACENKEDFALELMQQLHVLRRYPGQFMRRGDDTVCEVCGHQARAFVISY